MCILMGWIVGARVKPSAAQDLRYLFGSFNTYAMAMAYMFSAWVFTVSYMFTAHDDDHLGITLESRCVVGLLSNLDLRE